LPAGADATFVEAPTGLEELARIPKDRLAINRRDILTPRGGEWQPTTVVRLLARLRAQAG
jgi:hypothetical protein